MFGESGRYQARCIECRQIVTMLNDGCGPEEGHDDDCLWTIHDEIEAREGADDSQMKSVPCTSGGDGT